LEKMFNDFYYYFYHQYSCHMMRVLIQWLILVFIIFGENVQ